MIEKKRIELEKVQNVMARLDEIPKSVLTARQFIATYFDRLQTLQQSGRSLKAIYQFLLANGIDVGTYESFRTVYRRVKRVQKTQVVTENLDVITEHEKAAPPAKVTPGESEKAKNKNDDVQKRPRGVGLRPLCLADGTEIEIDPDTGARIFQIKSNKNKEIQT
jgi:hypothetical protein